MSMKKNKSNKNTNIIEIIAEYIYLVIIGDKATLKNFAINLKKNILRNFVK